MSTISMTVSVDPERAAYLAMLMEFWDAEEDGDFETPFSLRLLPDFLFSLGSALEMNRYATQQGINRLAASHGWTDEEKERIQYLLMMVVPKIINEDAPPPIT